MRIIKEGDDRLTAAVFQNEVTCMVAKHSHQKTMKTTGRLSFSLKKKKIEIEKPVRTTGPLSFS